MKWLHRSGYIPRHECHVSVFGGLGAEILALPPSKIEVFNDINDDVFNFMVRLKYDVDSMIRLAQSTWYHEKEYQRCYDVLHTTGHSDLERAHAFGVIANMCHVGNDPTMASRGSWGYSVKSHGQPGGWARIDVVYRAVAERLRRVQCCQRGWGTVFDCFDRPGTLFTVDPPYLGHRRMYKHVMTEAEHVQLLGRVRKLEGKVILFHSPNELYERELRSWTRIDIDISTAMGSTRAGHRKPRRTECIWANFTN